MKHVAACQTARIEHTHVFLIVNASRNPTMCGAESAVRVPPSPACIARRSQRKHARKGLSRRRGSKSNFKTGKWFDNPKDHVLRRRLLATGRCRAHGSVEVGPRSP